MSNMGILPHPVAERPWFERDELDFQEFTADGVRTFAVLEGRADGRPVVFLHDLPGAAFVWRPLLKAFPRTCRLIAFDLPGWGRSRVSGHTGNGTWTPEQYGRWLAAALTAQGVQSCDLIAHGCGATVACEYMALCPERTKRAVLIDPVFAHDAHSTLLQRLTALFAPSRWTCGDMQQLAAGLERDVQIEFEQLLLNKPEFNKRATAALRRHFSARAGKHVELLRQRARQTLMIRSHLRADPAWTSTWIDGGRWPMLAAGDELKRLISEFLLSGE